MDGHGFFRVRTPSTLLPTSSYECILTPCRPTRYRRAYLSCLRINKDCLNAKERHSCRTRFCLNRSRERGNDDAPRLGLPIGVDNCTLAPSDVLIVPIPSLGIDRLAYT